MVFIMYWFTVWHPALIIMPHKVKTADVKTVDIINNSQLTLPYWLKTVIARAASTDKIVNEITFDNMYSMVRNGETTTTDKIPCTFSSIIIPPIKNRPSTEGSENTTSGKVIDNAFSGKKDSMTRYIIVIKRYTR
jgi:hypothetical protein